jgi:hypothetical protein
MELKVGEVITEEVVSFVGGIVDDLGAAQGRIRALELEAEKAAETFDARVREAAAKMGKGGNTLAVVEDIKKELGGLVHHVDWKALFKKHKL